MDETSVKLWMDTGPGLVKIGDDEVRREVLQDEQKADLNKRRSCMSLMAFVADDPEVQRALPQILFVNERSLGPAQHAMLEQRLLDNPAFFICRRPSAWVTVDALKEVLVLLKHRLQAFLATRHILFCMDCSPVHASPKIAKAVARAGLYLHFIPARMTGQLQPLDAYVFGPLKQKLRNAYEDAQLRSPTGEVNIVELCLELAAVVKKLLQEREWGHAFRGCGFGRQQLGVGKRVRQRLK